MSLTLRTTSGCTEVIIADDGNLALFYHVAGMINDLRIKFVNKEDEFDSINWNFKFKGHPLTLHYNIYTGISLFPTKCRGVDSKDNKALMELGGVLENK